MKLLLIFVYALTTSVKRCESNYTTERFFVSGQRTGDNHVVTAVVTVIVIAFVITVVGFVILKKRRR